MKHAAHADAYDLSKATVASASGGYDLTKAAQTPQFVSEVSAVSQQFAAIASQLPNPVLQAMVHE